MREHKYELLLAGVISARATSFIFSKMVLETMDTFNLLAIRCLIAFFLLLIFFRRRMAHIKKNEVISGSIVGALFFMVMTSELTALKTTNSSTVALLENCAIIFVPLFGACIARKLPEKSAIISAFIALLGVFCLTAQFGSLSVGMLFGILAAVLYAFAIIVTAKVTHSDADPYCIGVTQVGTMGFLSLITSFAAGTPHMPYNGTEWIMILVLAVVCTGFGFTLQPVAQSHVSAERAGLFCAISPGIAAILGAAVLHESFGILSLVGLILILFSIALPYIKILKPQS